MSEKARLETDSNKRKEIPIATGVLDYFSDALAAVAELSWIGNQKHNAGQPLHWSRTKSTDHADCLIRHFLERGTVDTDGLLHDVKVAWRALAILQLEIEKLKGLPMSRGSSDE
jgi:dATP/dGTP diphosphohydrolase